MATETKKANGEIIQIMNPPAAIHSAMGRERKPFTYTPGGLDLSEIKSERMARRLMRNAMSPGVPESTSPAVQSPTGPPPAFPQCAHYNNLPVQVFPAFQLPANPKLLLRTRSTPQQPRDGSADRTPPPYPHPPPTSLPPVPRRSSAELSPGATTKLAIGPPPHVTSPPVLQSPQHVAATAAPRPEHIWSNGTEDIETNTPRIILEPCLRMPSEILQSNTEDKKVKSKKKIPISDDEVEVEATVKITKPKKTISTSVEIERKILPDGTVEETKTTTTNTIINGKIDDSKVQKETRILSPEEAKAVIEEESEEEEVEEEEEQVTKEVSKKPAVIQNGLSKEAEVSVKTETKKTVVTTETKEGSRTETKPESKKTISTTETKLETKTETVPESKKTISTSETKVETKTEEVEKSAVREATPSEEEADEEEESEEEEVEVIPDKPAPAEKQEPSKKVVEESEEEEVEDEEEEEVVEVLEEKTKSEQINEVTRTSEGEDEGVQEEEEEEIEEEVEVKEAEKKTEPATQEQPEKTEQIIDESKEVEEKPEDRITPEPEPSKPFEDENTSRPENIHTKTETSETKTETITSGAVPEEHTTTKKESTEITSSVSDNSFGRPVSTQTELHRVENIVTVNKTVKSLDNTYEQLTQHGVPTVRTYFAPPTREKLSSSPLPAKPYTPTFTPEQKPERRHSLLLDRLSIERQVAPPESYQNTYNYQSNQSYESVTKDQWNQEPQSEVVNVSNVKPSSISNSQWYQTPPQQQPNSIYNNVQPTTPNTQQHQQPSYSENLPYESPRPANTYQAPPETQSYAPKPSSWGSSNLNNLDRLPSINTQSNQYSFMSNKKTTESYSQQSTGMQQYSSGYVPPPWESEKSGVYRESTPQFYQAPTSAPISNTNVPPAWNSSPQQATYTAKPVSYQPPAPNASFVKQGTPTPKQIPGRKTYYSEYERRYISVPESTFIPAETKVQPQWDASPQYYYDNPEPTEEVEQPWRKELREFTEKTTQIEETTSVQPPWQEESNYPKTPSTPYTPQPTWSQTLRPRSFKEKSFDAETLQYQNTQEWPKSNTLNRRPVSAFVKTRLNSPGFERTRGVSVDRYNANSYQPPAPYTPAGSNSYSLPWETQQQPQIFSPTPQQYSDAGPQAASGPQTQQHYHNPQVPAYHARAPTEPREYHYQPRWSGQGRERPVQSRSFKYLQMLTGTEDGVEQPEPFVAQHPQHSAPRPRRA